MLKNYFIIAFRNLARHRIFSFINIFGFSIALVPVILTILYANYEFSYDKFNKNYKRIYRVAFEDKISGNDAISAMTPIPLAAAMKNEFPETETAARIQRGQDVVYRNDEKFEEKDIYYADPEIFKILSFEMIKGNPASALSDPFSVVISNSMAKKYFGNINPLGKTLKTKRAYYLTVKGVYKDFPKNSHLCPDFIIPISKILSASNDMQRFSGASAWGMRRLYTYIMLKENSTYEQVLNRFGDFYKKTSGFDSSPKLILQNISDIHLYVDPEPNPFTDKPYSKNGNVNKIYLYLIVAFIILLIAVINYVNLSSARASMRIKEVGVRKIVGAGRLQLTKQLLGETIIVTFCSFLISIFLVALILPYFNHFVERDIQFSIFFNITVIIYMAGFFISVSIVSGLYHAIIISSISPLSLFRGSSRIKNKSHFRNILVVIQFIFAIMLIFASLTVRNQLDFINTTDLGYNKNDIIVLNLNGNTTQSSEDALKNEISKNSNIVSVASSSAMPNKFSLGIFAEWPEKPPDANIMIDCNTVDYDFIDFYGMKIVKGRKFSKDYTSDENESVILNEAAVKAMGFNDPLGKIITYSSPWGKNDRKIIGVVKDFRRSMFDEVNPYYLTIDNLFPYHTLSIKIRPNTERETIAFLKAAMNKFQPEYPFKYEFFDEIINSSYLTENRLQSLFSIFAVFAIIIACLGLVGLISFTTETRKKEIGIRKVIGATVRSIVIMFSKEFAKWILAASIIALPIAYYLTTLWLRNFVCRINISWWIFFLSGGIALFIAMATVSLQAIKAAVADPVKTLRYE